MKTLTKILYIEDDIDIHFIAKIALVKLGKFDVKFCNSGMEALEVLKTYIPQLILLDVIMPEMDGITTIQKIRQIPANKNIPVI